MPSAPDRRARGPLRILDPCAERWDAMTGAPARRFCGACGKHVHALSEMTRSEAERLLASAPHGSLCVRVEHDEDGAVRFKDEPPAGPAGRAHPVLRLAVGASLLAASCGPAEPKDAPGAPELRPDTPALAAEPQPAPATTPAEAAPTTPPAEGAACAPQGGAQPSGKTKAAPGTRSPDAREPSRVTMGCVCAPGDTLCDCL